MDNELGFKNGKKETRQRGCDCDEGGVRTSIWSEIALICSVWKQESILQN